MADLVLNTSDAVSINDQTAMGLALDVSDNIDIIDNSIQVIPSYLDRVYINDIEHFINILSVE